MFWHMGLSTASPVEAILDKETFTLEELLDEDDIIQECRALNGRLISFLRERDQVKQLIEYVVKEASEDAQKQQTFKFPFVACEIFTCEVDIILKTLVEDEELMGLLFSFLDPEHSHSALLAGYFSKVVICLLLRKANPLLNYIQAHRDIINKLVDLIGITSIMEVLIRLIGSSDERIYSNCVDSLQWLEEMNVLEMIVDKFSSSDCPEVHANAAETLCIVTRYAPQGLASKISSPSFIGRLFRHALEESRPKSVLVNLLSVCISLLDPKRVTSGVYYMYSHQFSHGSGITANPETVECLLERLGDLLKLLDLSSEDHVLLTTYGKLQPPLGKHRLKIIEFISVLVAVNSEVAEKELIRVGALKHILKLFFEYPYHNFLHHHVENTVISCLGSKNPQFVDHLFVECNLIGKILEAENNFTLAVDASRPTVAAEGKSPPRIGNIGHITRIANKIAQLGNTNSEIQTFLQENDAWVDWQTNVLLKRNAVENVSQWACGRPSTRHDRTRDTSDDDYQYRIYHQDVIDEDNGPFEKDDEDEYFDNESAEVVISSLRLGDEQQESGSLFTNSNWFAYEGERTGDNEEHSADDRAASSSSSSHDDAAIVEEDMADTVESKPTVPPEWVQWRENSDTSGAPDQNLSAANQNEDTVGPSEAQPDDKTGSSTDDSQLSDASKIDGPDSTERENLQAQEKEKEKEKEKESLVKD